VAFHMIVAKVQSGGIRRAWKGGQGGGNNENKDNDIARWKSD
jgi:hypothetical protein